MKNFITKFYVGICFLFLYIPIVILVLLSFNNSRSRVVFGGVTLKWYKELFNDSTIMLAFKNTITIAFLSALIATLIALPAAIGINSMRKKNASIIMGLTNIPIINADIVTGIILMLTLSRFLKLGYSSILIAHITFNIPYVLLSILPRLKNLNPSIYESARDLGAGPIFAFFKVVFPEIFPSVMSGFFMAMTMSMDDFVVTYFTKGAGIDTLSTLIYGELKRGIKPEMYALSSVIFLVVLLVLIIVNYVPAFSGKGEKVEE